MTSYDELKNAAEWDLSPGSMGEAKRAFLKYATPATILTLLAEREKLLKVVKAANEIMDYGTRIEYRDLADALKELDK